MKPHLFFPTGIERLHAEMIKAANEQRYEDAVIFRDQMLKLRGEKVATPQPEPKKNLRKKR